MEKKRLSETSTRYKGGKKIIVLFKIIAAGVDSRVMTQNVKDYRLELLHTKDDVRFPRVYSKVIYGFTSWKTMRRRLHFLTPPAALIIAENTCSVKYCLFFYLMKWIAVAVMIGNRRTSDWTKRAGNYRVGSASHLGKQLDRNPRTIDHHRFPTWRSCTADGISSLICRILEPTRRQIVR